MNSSLIVSDISCTNGPTEYTVARGGKTCNFEARDGVFVPPVGSSLTVRDLHGLGFGCVGTVGIGTPSLVCTLRVDQRPNIEAYATKAGLTIISIEENQDSSLVAALEKAFYLAGY